ncbi:hypothetical protein [Nafulsella turpanensis]|nr:hypothetical protein [Nafulsella turpanensis]
MKQEEAIKILIQAAELANKRGAFSLTESKQVALAVEAFQVQEEQPEA